MARKKWGKCFTAVMLAGMITVTTSVSAPVHAESISELESQQEALEAKSEELSAALEEAKQNTEAKEALKQQYEENINQVQGQIDTLNQEIRVLDEEIAAKQKEIEGPQAEIDENLELLKQRIRAIYIAGETSTLDILLGAEDFSDFLDKASLLQTITSHDVTLIETIQEKVSAIQEEKDVIETSREQVSAKKAELDTQQQELTRLLEENQVILEELYGIQEHAQHVMDENDAELGEIEEQIASYYRAQAQNNAASSSSAPTSDSPANSAPVVAPYTGGAFVWPTPGFYYLSSQWNEDRGYYNHGAIDIAGGGIYGSPVVAAAGGTVVFSSAGGWGGGYGTYLMIDHGGGISTLYAHMSGLAVSQGATVSAGQTIGYVGSTGDSTGPHLHFEVRENGTKVNPMNYF